jgi:FkbM family methyltransferase
VAALRPGVTIKILQTRHGPMLALAGDRFITPTLEKQGEYAPEEAAGLAQLIRSGMTIVEVGSNIGAHTLQMARACAPGRLYAFEPQQRIFQLLCANLALNGIGNVLAYPDACGAVEGRAVVPLVDYDGPGNFGGVSLAGADAPGLPVRVVALDSLELPACDLIKIDAEGFEPQVLRGAAATIARCRPLIYTENDRADLQAEVISLLDGLGYRMYWHTPRLAGDGVFDRAYVSINMLCLPKERSTAVNGLELIDPANWRSPVPLAR